MPIYTLFLRQLHVLSPAEKMAQLLTHEVAVRLQTLMPSIFRGKGLSSKVKNSMPWSMAWYPESSNHQKFTYSKTR